MIKRLRKCKTVGTCEAFIGWKKHDLCEFLLRICNFLNCLKYPGTHKDLAARKCKSNSVLLKVLKLSTRPKNSNIKISNNNF